MEDISLQVPTYEDYGMDLLKRAPNQIIRELTAYLLTRGNYAKHVQYQNDIDIEKYDLRSPFQHCVNVCQLLFPTGLDLQVRGYKNTNTLRVLEALCTGDDIGLAGNAGASKTTPVAAWMVMDWLACPSKTTSMVASTTLADSEKRIWGRVEGFYKIAAKSLKPYGGIAGHLVGYRHVIAYEDIVDKDPDREYLNSISAIAYEEGEEGKKALIKTRGTHNDRVRLAVDELADMQLNVNAVRFNLKANIDFVYIGIGNPKAGRNPHSELCEPENGWETVDKEFDDWKTKTGVCVFLSGERSPNFQAPENEYPPFPYLLTFERKIEYLKLAHGNMFDLEYWRNCIGFWPTSEVERTVLSRAMLAKAMLEEEPIWGVKPLRVVAGFDTGWAMGGDKCCTTFMKVGENEDYVNMAYYLKTSSYQPDVREVFEASIAQQVVADCINMKVKPADFGMDVSGDGGKMLQAIMIEWMKYDPTAMEIVPLSSLGKPSERRVSEQDNRLCCDAYDRKVTEYWYSFRQAIQCRVLYGIDMKTHLDLVDQLTERYYDLKSNKISVEKKEDMKKRIGHSPDDADSATYALEMARRAGLTFVQYVKSLPDANSRYWGRRGFPMGDEQPQPDDEETEVFSYADGGVDEDGF
jgi:hypothetical protein